MENTKIFCNNCNNLLSANHKGPCPICKNESIRMEFISSGGGVAGGSAPHFTSKSFYKKNPKLLIAVILITLGSPFLGLFFAGFNGVVIGLILGIICFVLGLKCITLTHEKKFFNS